MKTVIYARKSRGTQEELNSQIEICKDYCSKNGYTIAEIFSEIRSSQDFERVQYTALKNYIKDNTAIRVVVSHADRLNRNLIEQAKLNDLLLSTASYVEDIIKSDCLAHLEIQLSKLYDQLREDKELLKAHDSELQAVKAEIFNNREKLSKLNTLFIMDNISQAELTEKSAEIKNKIDLLELKQQRLEGYSLFKISQDIQDRVVKLEELRESNDINSLVKLVNYVSYYKDSAGISVKTKFKE